MVKKLVTSMVIACIAISSVFCETIHIKKAYLMSKYSDGSVYIIRVQLDDGYHDWYVTSSDKPWLFYGYETDDEIIVDETIDIAIKR